jgi:hypothetical protein
MINTYVYYKEMDHEIFINISYLLSIIERCLNILNKIVAMKYLLKY